MAQLLKVQGSDNRFFLLDQTRLQNTMTDAELSRLAKDITDPANQVLHGADGLLVVDRTDSQALGQMKVFNADGSQASMCGNGLRNVARYLSEKDYQNSFTIRVSGTDLTVHKQEPLAARVPAFSVEIAPVKFNKQSFPFTNLQTKQIINQKVPQLDDDLKFTAIALPNPHLISFVDQDQDFKKLGPLGKYLNSQNPYFPDGVNVSFVKIMGRDQIFVKTYERGVGFTNACGTGMSAASLALVLNYPSQSDYDQDIRVENPGGMVKTSVHHQNDRYWIDLTGNATFTDRISVPEVDLHRGTVNKNNVRCTSTGEEKAYRQLVKNIKNSLGE